MKPALVFDPEAQSEFDESYDFYQNRQKGLGEEFAKSIKNVLLEILANPKPHGNVFHDTRRVRVARFPFVVYYRIENSTIRIISVSHTSRDPKTWQSRTQ